MDMITRPLFRLTIDEIEVQATVNLDVSREAILTELRFRDGRRARKLYQRLHDTCSPEQTSVPVAAPTEPVQSRKAPAKVRVPPKAKRAPTGSLEPHKPGPVMRAAMAARARFRTNPHQRAFEKLLATKEGYRERYERMLAMCKADNEAFWRRNPAERWQTQEQPA
jgi:hypothetical protein